MATMDAQQPSQGVPTSDTSIGPAADERTPLLPGSSASAGMSSATGRGGSVSSASSSLRSRKSRSGKKDDSSSLVDGPEVDDMPTLQPDAATAHPKWVAFALFSGAFAAMNGVFAKLCVLVWTLHYALVFELSLRLHSWIESRLAHGHMNSWLLY